MDMTVKKTLRALAAAAALVLLLLLAAPVFADVEYSGVLDPMTNQPAGSAVETVSGTDRVQISNTMYYDWSTHDYVYPIDGSLTEVHVTAADGMYLNVPVSIDTGGDETVGVYHNGAEYTGDLSTINEAGDYVVQARVGGGSRRIMSFTLVGPYSNAIQRFTVPDGFFVTSATLDGQDAYSDRYVVDMTKEGVYEVEYECMSTDLAYTLSVEIDRTPPALAFQGKIGDDNQVRSALKFSGVEKGGTLSLLRNGELTDVYVEADGTGVIRDTGIYVLRAYDAAGNVKEYDFSILMYFDTGSWIFIALVIASIAAVIAYVMIKRKRLRIG